MDKRLRGIPTVAPKVIRADTPADIRKDTPAAQPMPAASPA